MTKNQKSFVESRISPCPYNRIIDRKSLPDRQRISDYWNAAEPCILDWGGALTKSGVDLAFEGHRFWDVRRWKELKETADIYGIKITKNNGTVHYEKFLLETREVTDNMYFYPIPNTERFKNQNLGQNPGGSYKRQKNKRKAHGK